MDTLFILMTIASIQCSVVAGFRQSTDCSEGITSVNYSPPITRSVCASMMRLRTQNLTTQCIQLPIIDNKKKKVKG